MILPYPAADSCPRIFGQPSSKVVLHRRARRCSCPRRSRGFDIRWCSFQGVSRCTHRSDCCIVCSHRLPWCHANSLCRRCLRGPGMRRCWHRGRVQAERSHLNSARGRARWGRWLLLILCLCRCRRGLVVRGRTWRQWGLLGLGARGSTLSCPRPKLRKIIPPRHGAVEPVCCVSAGAVCLLEMALFQQIDKAPRSKRLPASGRCTSPGHPTRMCGGRLGQCFGGHLGRCCGGCCGGRLGR